ncbi:MAG: hypothetical protein EPO28_08655 [Saprospiraceae bacterium]|nr:MAG: hypothetical protein EPO28_08655 [Saprospiraceae bacterium]
MRNRHTTFRFRKAVVTKHFSIIYQVKGKFVYVVAFTDNRSKDKFWWMKRALRPEEEAYYLK